MRTINIKSFVAAAMKSNGKRTITSGEFREYLWQAHQRQDPALMGLVRDYKSNNDMAFTYPADELCRIMVRYVSWAHAH
jgi:hypothetical protein